MDPVTTSALATQLRALGVRPGGVLVVHMSFRAVRPVEGGPAGVIDALLEALGPNGTLVMPSWTGDDDTPFDPLHTPVSPDLGVTPEVFRQRPGVRRSNHPFAFAALGPQAESITGDPLPIPPHRVESAIGRVWERNGQILLLGVGHDSNTTIHLAEALAQVPYAVPKHVTVLRDGRPVRIDYGENDHCCRRFTLADEWLRVRGLQRDGRVGNAEARLVDSQDVVAVVRKHLGRDPLLFLHEDACEECRAARHSLTTTRIEHVV
jgi:aminoglycoside N3'-acetyltransferase